MMYCIDRRTGSGLAGRIEDTAGSATPVTRQEA